MAIVYRGMWSDSDDGVGDRLQRSLEHWVGYKSGGRLGLADGITDDGVIRVKVERAEDSGGPIDSVFRFSFTESRENGVRWTTTVRYWSGPAVTEEVGSGGSWLWVDLDLVSHDELDRVNVSAPRFARDLLAASHTARRRCVPLAGSPITYEGESGAEQLAEIVTDMERDLPVVVFAALPADFELYLAPPGFAASAAYLRSVKRAAEDNAGLAQVCRLDEEATTHFGTILGEDYGVRDGAFRIYLPGADPALRDGWRHRYTVAARYLRKENSGPQIFRAVSPRAGIRRAAPSYESAAALLEQGMSGEDREMLNMAIAVADDLERHKVDLDQRYGNLVEDQQSLEEENIRLRQQLSIAWKENALLRSGSLSTAPDIEAFDAVDPAEIDSPSTAALQAQEVLPRYLSLPDEACVDLDDLDAAVEAKAWGQTAWRAFLALHAYGETLSGSESPADFWTWCIKSGHPHVWTATPKKLAMSESETVMNNPKLAAKRVFPVDLVVKQSGRIEMQAHIKIAEGGGSRAPRIYFLPSREYGKVFVGYFGPHKNVPNGRA
ncbi:hypothetical protein [Lentzea sp.]|uniref:hypothetical protein n=1 Tax=Lentzea sp. TaxID=56099 RepID=UPI002C4DCEC6|nr:hypothetical protein [Lentzea sp.]HUQ59699.1 hypothetical protein [Lentzea sp.]